MPKINKHQERIEHQDIDKNFEYQIFYSNNEFWARIPPELEEAFDALTEVEQIAYSAKKRYRSRYSRTEGGEHMKIVSAESESALVENMRTLIIKLLTATIVKRPVIILTFVNRGEQNSMDHSLKQIGLDMDVDYGFEVTAAGGTVKYYKYHKDEWTGENEPTRQEIRFGYRKKPAIIQDTPEARKYVESLHSALKALIERLQRFTDTSEELQKIIDSNQKFLH